MTRPSKARVDLNALRHNYSVARNLHGGRALAVLKANAYGHGAVRCAQALQSQADGFAVAFLDEAEELRAAGIHGPILVLEGLFDAEEWATAQALDVWVVVHHAAQLSMLEQAPISAALQVWLKVDSGMGRAGFAPADVADAYARLQRSGKVSDIVLMSHFARADDFRRLVPEQDEVEMLLAWSDVGCQRQLAQIVSSRPQRSRGALELGKAHQQVGRACSAVHLHACPSNDSSRDGHGWVKEGQRTHGGAAV